MRRSRVSAGLVVVAAGIGVLSAVAPAGAIVHGVRGVRGVREEQVKPGLVVSARGLGKTLVASGDAQGQIAVDATGGSYIFAEITGPTGRPRYRYLTERAHAKSFVSHPVSMSKSQYIAGSTVITPGGKHVDVVVANCRGLFTATTTIKSPTMPKPRQATNFDPQCPGPDADFGFGYGDFLGAAALAHAKLAVFARPDTAADQRVHEYIGTPGGRFTSVGVVPHLGEGTVAALTRDPANGDLVVAYGEGDGTTIESYYAEVKPPGGCWRKAVRVATVTATGGDFLSYGLFTVAAMGGKVAISISPTYVDASGKQRGQLLMLGTEAGSWQPPVAPAHSTNRDLRSHVAFCSNGELILVFNRRITGKTPNRGAGTIYSETLKRGTWSKLTALSRNVFSNIDSLSITPANRPVVDYTRYATAGAENE